MERLTIDEIIEHCNKTCDMTEKIAKARGHELEIIESNQFWEHYQVRSWLKELKQYKDLEKQGLLLKLPCRVGDTVYVPHRGKIQKMIIQMVSWNGTGFFFSWTLNSGIYPWLDGFGDMNIGKTVFLTQTEAEQKLKEMESDRDVKH